MKFIALLLSTPLVAAFMAPSAPFSRGLARLNAEKDPTRYGKYDDELWDMDAKQDIYAAWNPNEARSPQNFNPFETFGGNSPDASGVYPGEQG